MEFVPLSTGVFTKGEDFFAFFCTEKEKNTLSLSEYSVVVISSKIVALSQNRVSDEPLNALIQKHSQKIIAQTGDFFLTRAHNIIIPNAGIDSSNAPKGTKILWPENPQGFADTFREKLQKKFGVSNLGVIISDSRITPARKGTTGLALAWSGIAGVFDERGKNDIYGKPLSVSTINIADNAVSGSEILMGQSNAQVPFVVIKNFPEKFFTDTPQSPNMAVMPKDEDLFQNY
jgi:F420-0:gamma-glutamyl ligase